MSTSDQSLSSLESQLGALQCHFTWGLEGSRSRLRRLQSKLEDIGTEDGTGWLGHIYNLQGFIQCTLGSAPPGPQDRPTPRSPQVTQARTLFTRAAEALRRDPRFRESWLLVNYSNLAWLHHHQGEPEESRAYLAKVDDLMEQHPPPSQDERHPEVNAEKAWTLMKFGQERIQEAKECFQSATRRKPEVVEWNTSYVLLQVREMQKSTEGPLDEELLGRLREASERDPQNRYLAVQCLCERARRGEDVRDEAQELAERILENPISSYSGMKRILRIYRDLDRDEAVRLAEEALRRNPDQRYLKACAALCYKWKITFSNEGPPELSLIDRAVQLHEEVIALYSVGLGKRIDLADVKAKSPRSQDKVQAQQIYQELLQQFQLEPADKQMLYNRYAKFLNFSRGDRNRSIRYHMRAAEIPSRSFFRENSIKTLQKIRERGRNRLCGEIEELLRNLSD